MVRNTPNWWCSYVYTVSSRSCVCRLNIACVDVELDGSDLKQSLGAQIYSCAALPLLRPRPICSLIDNVLKILWSHVYLRSF